MRAVAANFGPRQQDLKTKVRFDLTPQPLERLAEELLHPSAAQTNHVRVLLFGARLVIVLIAAVMHQIELIDQPAFLQQLQRTIDRDAIQLGVFLLGHLKQLLGVEVLPGLIDQLEKDLPLARQAYALIFERSANTVE